MALDVLIVDDSSITRRMIARALRMAGLPVGQVLEAQDGVEGLLRLSEATIDLAILDINMPNMNGLEMLARIRASEETRSLPVVVVSTEGSDARIEMIRAQGAGFIRKPFAPELLIEAVVQAIGGES